MSGCSQRCCCDSMHCSCSSGHLLLELIIAKLVQLLLLSVLLVVLCSSPSPDVSAGRGGHRGAETRQGVKKGLNTEERRSCSAADLDLINHGGGCSQGCCAGRGARNCVHGVSLPSGSLSWPADREGSAGIAHPDVSLTLQGCRCTAPGPFPELAKPPQNSLRAFLQQMQVPQHLQPLVCVRRRRRMLWGWVWPVPPEGDPSRAVAAGANPG